MEAGSSQEEGRVNQVFDRVNTTGTVWLGTTMECTQCHNHKYDPFTQREYYQLFAFFNNTPIETKSRSGKKDEAAIDFLDAPSIAVPLSPIVDTERPELERQYAELERQWKARKKIVVEGFPEWEKKATEQAQRQRGSWQVLAIDRFLAKSGAGSDAQSDGSHVVTGKVPQKDTYTVTVRTKLRGITALRLEALHHKSLPKNGPGRRPNRPNFVLTELRVSAKDASSDDAAQPVKLVAPQSSFHQPNFHAGRAIDGNDATGWAIAAEFGKSHWATFRTAKPIGDGDETLLAFVIQQNHGSQRTIGRLRLSAMVGEATTAGLPDYITTILRRKPADRGDSQKQSLLEYLVKQDPSLQKMTASMVKIKTEMEAAPGGTTKSTKTLVMVEMNQPRMSNLLKRGNFETKGIEVKAGVPESLHPLPDGAPSNRLGLAHWLVDRKNPLVARVTVNRWWAEFFGTGIVSTPEDFGTQGRPPDASSVARLAGGRVHGKGLVD